MTGPNDGLKILAPEELKQIGIAVEPVKEPKVDVTEVVGKTENAVKDVLPTASSDEILGKEKPSTPSKALRDFVTQNFNYGGENLQEACLKNILSIPEIFWRDFDGKTPVIADPLSYPTIYVPGVLSGVIKNGDYSSDNVRREFIKGFISRFAYPNKYLSSFGSFCNEISPGGVNTRSKAIQVIRAFCLFGGNFEKFVEYGKVQKGKETERAVKYSIYQIESFLGHKDSSGIIRPIPAVEVGKYISIGGVENSKAISLYYKDGPEIKRFGHKDSIAPQVFAQYPKQIKNDQPESMMKLLELKIDANTVNAYLNAGVDQVDSIIEYFAKLGGVGYLGNSSISKLKSYPERFRKLKQDPERMMKLMAKVSVKEALSYSDAINGHDVLMFVEEGIKSAQKPEVYLSELTALFREWFDADVRQAGVSEKDASFLVDPKLAVLVMKKGLTPKQMREILTKTRETLPRQERYKTDAKGNLFAYGFGEEDPFRKALLAVSEVKK